MMDVDFYNDIIDYCRKNNKNIPISFTTNLWDWFINPNKWDTLFKQPEIYITTSFQYGKGRQLNDGTIFDKDLFISIIEKFKKMYNYVPSYISVLTDENDKYALENVKLAKTLNTTCKLNGAVCSGKQTYRYSLEKLYSIYLQLFENNLYLYEENCKNLINYFNNKHTICPISLKYCLKTIKTMLPDGSVGFCPALTDDNIYDTNNLIFYKKECLTCEFFNICNGCYKQIYDLKKDNQLENCQNFKNILTNIKKFISERKLKNENEIKQY